MSKEGEISAAGRASVVAFFLHQKIPCYDTSTQAYEQERWPHRYCKYLHRVFCISARLRAHLLGYFQGDGAASECAACFRAASAVISRSLAELRSI